MKKQLRYEKVNNSNDTISIDLHNGYSVIAVSGWNPEKKNYTTTLRLKEKSSDDWKLIEDAENLEFNATYKTINSAILKHVSVCLDSGFFEKYIANYEFELECFAKGLELIEKDWINSNAV